MSETWKRIPGFPDYEASSLGRVRSDRSNTILSPQLLDSYYILGIRPEGSTRRKTVRVHRLVCLAFHGIPSGDACNALHRNDVHTDNREGNLYWGTFAENMADKNANGKQTRGEKHFGAILSAENVLHIRKVYIPRHPELGARPLSLLYGVHKSVISQVVTRRIWQHI